MLFEGFGRYSSIKIDLKKSMNEGTWFIGILYSKMRKFVTKCDTKELIKSPLQSKAGVELTPSLKLLSTDSTVLILSVSLDAFVCGSAPAFSDWRHLQIHNRKTKDVFQLSFTRKAMPSFLKPTKKNLKSWDNEFARRSHGRDRWRITTL